MFDETGYPINLDDQVEVTKPTHLRAHGSEAVHHREPNRDLAGRQATVVGLDTIDWRTGKPRGDHLIYIRIEGDEALCHIHPARVRVITRKRRKS